MIRVAIYYTPPEQSPLSRAAAQWLGRNSTSLTHPEYCPAGALALKRYSEIIASPFHYGFHGTIKPPFRLLHGVDINAVASRLRGFAENYSSFILPPLEVTYMHNFFCLRPISPSKTLDQLAADAVILFDEYRRPADKAEVERRRAAGLTANQEKSLLQWGYPYLMVEFRFHLTLTGRIENDQERLILEEELRARFPQEILQSVPFSSLSLFMEINNEPMKLIHRFALSA
jgi:hypothetical protein